MPFCSGLDVAVLRDSGPWGDCTMKLGFCWMSDGYSNQKLDWVWPVFLCGTYDSFLCPDGFSYVLVSMRFGVPLMGFVVFVALCVMR